MRTLNYLLVALLMVMVEGCAPRGETKSLDEILANARYGFKSTDLAGLDGVVSGQIEMATKQIEMSITQAQSGSDSAQALAAVAGALADLTSKAGVTSRPAMSELATQYRELGGLSPKNVATEGQVKLLAARTYTLLNSELTTTRFSS